MNDQEGPESRPVMGETGITFRGRRLPAGMTPGCHEELVAVIAEFERGDFDGTVRELACRVFSIVRGCRSGTGSCSLFPDRS